MVGIAFRRLRASNGRAWSTLKFLGGVSVGAFVLALGDNTPVFPFLFRHIPTFNLFQAPTRWNLLLVFSLPIMAGLGFDSWRPPQGRALYWTRLLTAGAGVIGLAAWIGSTLLLETQPTFVRAFALAGLWLFAAGLLALTKSKLKRDVWIGTALMVVLVDLVLAGWGLNPSVPTQVYETKMAINLGDTQRYYLPSDLEYSLTYERYFTFDSFQSQYAWTDVIRDGIPNTNALVGIPSVNNFDPIRPERTERWLGSLEELSPEIQDGYLQAANVALAAIQEDFGELRYRSIAEAQRAYLVSEAVTASSLDEALDQLFAPGFDPLMQVVIEGEITPNQTSSTALSESIEIVASSDPNRVSLLTSSSAGGWLVLADSWYPGWKAAIDGVDTPIYSANVVFRAVWLPPGEHTVTFVYSPQSLKIGAALFVASLIFLTGLWVTWKRN
jgi:hypothetical protein